MELQRTTYRVKGISHHDVADRLGVWLPECIGRRVILAIEKAEENDLGVECVAVYDVDKHVGYIDDNQKLELLTVLKHTKRRTLRSEILGYDEGLGPKEGWRKGLLTISAPRISDAELSELPNEYVASVSPWEDWSYNGQLLPRTAMERRLDIVRETLMDMMDYDEPWGNDAKEYVKAFVSNGVIDLSCEMRQDMLRLIHWLEMGECEEMKSMADGVMSVMMHMGSEDLRPVYVQSLITERTNSEACLTILQNASFDEMELRDCYDTMPYRTGQGNEDVAGDKRFVAKLYYDNTLSRGKLQEIYSVIALTRRLEMLQKDKASKPMEDNEVVVAKETHQEVVEDITPSEACIAEQLKPIFYGNSVNAQMFLKAIRGMKPKGVTDYVNKLLDGKEKVISPLSCHRDLWKVLHDNGLYNPTEGNWNKYVK